MKKITLALLLTSIFTTNASAEGIYQNLDTILKGIETAAGAVSKVSTVSDNYAAETKTDSSVDEILMKYKDKNPLFMGGYVNQNGKGSMEIHSTECVDNNFKNYERLYKNSLNSGDSTAAQIHAEKLAGGLASCALSKYPYVQGYNKQHFVRRTGEILSNIAIITNSYEVKDEAEKLLNASGAGKAQIEKMNKAFGLGAAVTNKPLISASPYAIVSMKNRNAAAFDRKFSGQIIEVTGNVTKVNGNERKVEFSLKGANKDEDSLAWSDYVYCLVTNESEIIKSEAFGVGDKVKIKGYYEKGILNKINLNECSVRSAK